MRPPSGGRCALPAQPQIELPKLPDRKWQYEEIAEVCEDVDATVRQVPRKDAPTHALDAAGGVARAADGVAAEEQRQRARLAVSPRQEHLSRHAPSHCGEVDGTSDALLDRLVPVEHRREQHEQRADTKRTEEATPRGITH